MDKLAERMAVLETKMDTVIDGISNHLKFHEKITYAYTTGAVVAVVLALIKWATGL